MVFNKNKTYGNCLTEYCENLAVYKKLQICNVCYNRKRYLENIEYNRTRAIATQKKKWQENPELEKRKRKNNSLVTTYGITIEEYETQFEMQKGCCAICTRHQSSLGRSLAVDHCHITGKIRGLLCHHCNAGIGNLMDDVDIITSALNYIETEGVWFSV